eukprot:12421057-Karenia_brevis.AAC.1
MYWFSEHAKEHLMSNIEKVVDGLKEGAERTMSEDPPPAGPSYCIVHLDAEKPLVITVLDSFGTQPSIDYTYCIEVR